MKILITATVMSHVAQFHKPLAKVLHRHGCLVEVAARDNLAEKNGLNLNWADKIYDVPFERSPLSRSNLKAYKRLRQIISEGAYDIIHCNTPMGGIVTRLAARGSGTRVIYTAHGFHFYRGASRKAWMIYYPIEKLFCRLTSTLITINREDRDLSKRRFKVDTEYIHGVGVDASRYIPERADDKLRRELGVVDRRVILNIGELLPNKGQRFAIEAIREVVRRHKNALLVIAGNGPERNALEAQVNETGLTDSVRFIGYCTCLEKWQRAAEMLVACSRREGLPLNVVETMLSGNPAVVSDNRGHRELVDDGVTGFIVPHGDSIAIADRICRLLDDGDLRTRMGNAALSKGLLYSAENVEKELEHIYFQ